MQFTLSSVSDSPSSINTFFVLTYIDFLIQRLCAMSHVRALENVAIHASNSVMLFAAVSAATTATAMFWPLKMCHLRHPSRQLCPAHAHALHLAGVI